MSAHKRVDQHGEKDENCSLAHVICSFTKIDENASNDDSHHDVANDVSDGNTNVVLKSSESAANTEGYLLRCRYREWRRIGSFCIESASEYLAEGELTGQGVFR